MAGGSWTTRHIVRDLPAAHRDAYAQFYRSPAMMINVAVRNWRFLEKLGISGCRWFEGLGSFMQMRHVAACGAAAPTIHPDQPAVITVKVIYPTPGLPTEEQGRRGRAEMLSTSFSDYERRIRTQFDDMFARAGSRRPPGYCGHHSQSVGPRVREPPAGLVLRIERQAGAARGAAGRAVRPDRLREHRPVGQHGSSKLDHRSRSRGRTIAGPGAVVGASARTSMLAA